jgi:hypothetical protein
VLSLLVEELSTLLLLLKDVLVIVVSELAGSGDEGVVDLVVRSLFFSAAVAFPHMIVHVGYEKSVGTSVGRGCILLLGGPLNDVCRDLSE